MYNFLFGRDQKKKHQENQTTSVNTPIALDECLGNNWLIDSLLIYLKAM